MQEKNSPNIIFSLIIKNINVQDSSYFYVKLNSLEEIYYYYTIRYSQQ